LSNHYSTEEGLATLNTLIASGERHLWSPALNYWAVCKASRLSFVDLFSQLEPYVTDERKRFKICTRVKRGLADTSQPGACTLDQAYFRGSVDILRKINSVDIRLLYCGQTALADMQRLRNLIRTHCIRLPPFMDTPTKYEVYVDSLKKIAEVNMIS
jgi:hypothetical protein